MFKEREEGNLKKGVKKIEQLIEDEGDIPKLVESFRKLIESGSNQDLIGQVLIRSWTNEELSSSAEVLLALIKPVYDGHLEYISQDLGPKGKRIARLIQAEANRRQLGARWFND